MMKSMEIAGSEEPIIRGLRERRALARVVVRGLGMEA
jgi:hypothetical protein